MTGDLAAGVAREVSALLAPVFQGLEQVAERAAASRPADGEGWSEGDLREVRASILALLGHDELCVGAGFVAVPGAVDRQERYMLWWQRRGERTARLRVNLDRTSVDVYDYVEMDWFRFAGRDRPRVLVGPYVDYAGSELYILTASVPVLDDGVTVGIAGADLLSGELERRLLTALNDTTAELLIVNRERQIVASNSPRWMPGARLRSTPEPGARIEDRVVLEAATPEVEVGWTVAVTTPASSIAERP